MQSIPSLIVGAGTVVDLLSAVVIVYHVLWALLAIVQRKGSDAARIRIAQGVLAALGFSVAGSLLKIIGLQTWSQIRLFAFVFLLRTMLKRVFGMGRRADRAANTARKLLIFALSRKDRTMRPINRAV